MSPDISQQERHEEALASVRESLAAIQDVPAAALDTEKHERLLQVDGDLRSLEKGLTNEVEQLREQDGDPA
jgi:hypothetical protein